MKLKMGFVIALLVAIGLQACASQSVMLIHPQSGSIVRCEEEGIGLLAGAVGTRVHNCLESYRSKGYVRSADLTREQHADLERRGLLPKPEVAPLRMPY